MTATATRMHEVHCILIRLISLPAIAALDVWIVAHLIESITNS